MKQRILCAAAVLLLVLTALCGCSRLSNEKNILGSWRSPDGYTVTFDGSLMTVTDTCGEVLDGFPVRYTVVKNSVFAAVGSDYEELFECRPDGDSMELIYSDAVLMSTVGSAEKTVTIELERCEDR